LANIFSRKMDLVRKVIKNILKQPSPSNGLTAIIMVKTIEGGIITQRWNRSEGHLRKLDNR